MSDERTASEQGDQQQVPAPYEQRCVLVAMVALQQANRYPISIPGMGNDWSNTVAEITERDAKAVVEALSALGLLFDAESIPIADHYSREEFGEAEAWGWNQCREYVIHLQAPVDKEGSERD